MATEGNIEQIPGLSASADLSAKQYRFMKLSGDFTVTVCSGVTDTPVGVLQNNPKSGLEAGVAFKGATKITLGGTVVAGDRVGTDANGAAVKLIEGTDTTKYVAGTMLEGGAVNEIRSMLLVSVPHRAS